MKKIIIFAITILIPVIAFSNDSSGVKKINYSIGLNYTNFENRYVDEMYFRGLSASINFPIYKYIGSSIYFGATEGSIKRNSTETTYDGYSMGGEVFMRDKNIGKLGVSGSYSNMKSHYNSPLITSSNIKTKGYTYSIDGAYYYNNFSFNANRSTNRSEVTTNGTLIQTDQWYTNHVLNLRASYYINENTEMHISKRTMDTENNFGIGIGHQPSFLNDTTEIGVQYSDEKHDNYSIGFYINYFFNTDVTLKTRDREYR